jgi:hypothetical protein
MPEHWSEQYEETAKRMELLGHHEASDDIRTLVDALKQYEHEEKERLEPPLSAPRFLTTKDVLDSDYFPERVDFPKEYFPADVGPGSFDPRLLYAHALTIRASSVGGMIPYETKCWVILWLLDHVDWHRVKVNMARTEHKAFQERMRKDK